MKLGYFGTKSRLLSQCVALGVLSLSLLLSLRSSPESSRGHGVWLVLAWRGWQDHLVWNPYLPPKMGENWRKKKGDLVEVLGGNVGVGGALAHDDEHPCRRWLFDEDEGATESTFLRHPERVTRKMEWDLSPSGDLQPPYAWLKTAEGEKEWQWPVSSYSTCPCCINIHESLVKETNGSHKTCHVLPSFFFSYIYTCCHKHGH